MDTKLLDILACPVCKGPLKLSADKTELISKGAGLAYTAESVNYIFDEYYDKRGIRARGCHPRDVIAHIEDIAKYREVAPELSPDLIDRACQSYFLESGAA